MKANELMIGDWVQAIDACCGEPCILRVTYIDKWKLERPHVGVDGDISQSSLPADCLEGIPITEEILGKNGFKQIGKKFIWGEIDDDLIEITPSINNSYRIKVSVADLMTSCNIWCSYVHELQHALRLCGIEKDIIEL